MEPQPTWPGRPWPSIWPRPDGTPRLAVERNGNIVPRARYGETVLEDGDVLEIVRFVGGG